ncbi:hypothetical protein GCM10010399_08490 [Dactylosporangium fulvum]|uniref:ATP-grasp domain-containing protein n=1 Tax=Dactylosporangium fulvum TaxID=53359 RepID=A0ABY5W8V2_9ACTN|nr:ATP-grasp domain-containing protein [Dactylosporangium fulvum]UWP86513.1 ATP-grasp domain-containing protein [Dactylosporangium fulvum]
MTSARILLLEAAGPEAGAIAATAIGLGHQVYALTQDDYYATYSADLRNALSGCLLTDLSRPASSLDELVAYARKIRADAVLTTNEYLTPLLARACAALGLPGNDPDLAPAARNKATMHQALTRHGVPTPRTEMVASEAQLRHLCATGQIAFPCVVKPAEAAGSAGVTVVRDPSAIAAAWRTARTPRGMYGISLDTQVLIQEHVDGAEYSVESITQQGHTRHLCTTRKQVASGQHPIELGHSLPATLPPGIEHTVHRAVERAITAVGIRNGPSHTEVMVGEDGRCTVIEISARLGAGQIGFLIQHALGINPWSALLNTALGRPATLDATQSHYATVRFLTSPHAGRLRAVHGLPQRSPEVPDVRIRTAIGDRVRKAQDNRSRIGHLIVTGPNAEHVERHADQLMADVRIEVDPKPNTASTTRHVPISAPEFDALYSSQTGGGGVATVMRIVDPLLPIRVEPFSFLSADLLHHLSNELALQRGQLLTDLGCGRGGPGLWLAHLARVRLIGVDFSAVAAAEADRRAAAFGMDGTARFIVADLTAIGLADRSADAAVSIDAFQYAAPAAVLGETRRILRPGGRLVLTGWHPRKPGDRRLPQRHRTTDWPKLLRRAGFTPIRCVANPDWTATYLAIYQVALTLGDPGDDLGLAGLQQEAARRLPTAHLLHRVAVTAVAS